MVEGSSFWKDGIKLHRYGTEKISLADYCSTNGIGKITRKLHFETCLKTTCKSRRSKIIVLTMRFTNHKVVSSPWFGVTLLISFCICCKVGQRQPGLFGFLERTLAKTQDHIWFERTEMKDRLIVTRRYFEILFVFFCATLNIINRIHSLLA